MSILKKIITLPIRPIQSEAAATSLMSFALIIWFMLLAYRWVVGPAHGIIMWTAIIILLIGLPYAGLSLIIRAKHRSYRDNTGSRAMCELIGCFSLFSFFIIMSPRF